jgi:hypothetical protein
MAGRPCYCYCYACAKLVLAGPDLTCPECHEDYLEYDGAAAPSPAINYTLPDPLAFINQLFNLNRHAGDAAGGTPLANWFRMVVGRFLPLGHQFGDFFAGNAEQWQALADRLFRLDNQALGSPPAAEPFVQALAPVPWRPGAAAEDTCTICLEQFAEGAVLFVLPCKHAFHTDCISPWLKMHSECPSCRYKLPS